MRDDFLADIRAVVQHGLVPAAAIADLKGGQGLPNLSFDLNLLMVVARQYFSEIKNKCSITMPDIALGEQRGSRLQFLAGGRNVKQPRTVEEATKNRQKSYTLLVYSFSQVRRGVGFFRWDEGDLEVIAPSIYAGKASPKAAASTDAGASTSGNGAAASATAASPVATAAPAPSNPLITPNPVGSVSKEASTTSVPLSLLGPSTPFGK